MPRGERKTSVFPKSSSYKRYISIFCGKFKAKEEEAGKPRPKERGFPAEDFGETGKDYSIFMLGLYYLARLWEDISIHFRR